jgi:hypothetical protein
MEVQAVKHVLTVGQKLWLVPSQQGYRQPREATVTSVGRKWATLDTSQYGRDRISLETLAVDGGDYVSPGQCWLSREDWVVATLADTLWQQFRKSIEYGRRPNGITAEAIQQAAELLGVKLEVGK